jgi:restriction system protein
MTTSTFSKDAREYVEGLDSKVILVDGARLAELMFEHGVGVATVNTYSIKRIDSDFFEEEVPVVLGEEAANRS